LPGESGCGETIGRTILKLEEATSGRIRFTGADITHHTAGKMRKLRRHVPNTIAHACLLRDAAILTTLPPIQRLSLPSA
jgi:ABC-type oligopeptide transport system ATPase subunit